MQAANSPYSPLKVFWHRDSIDELRRGGQPVPKQVQLVISDLCNENCSFCGIFGTRIYTEKGIIPIQEIEPGMRVWSHNSTLSTVTKAGQREVDSVIKLNISETCGWSLSVTDEHPILTDAGWKQAGDVAIGDWVWAVTGYGQAAPPFFRLRQIKNKRRIEGRVDVYNFSCSPHESYIANGVIVHNCAYRMSGYTSNELFKVVNSSTGQVNNNPNRMIPYDKVIEILDDCVAMGVKAIQITGGGEPTVHPRHAEIFEAVLQRGMELGLVTNGLVLREGVADLLAAAAWVRVSIDAGNRDTYSSMRGVKPEAYDKVLRNIGELVKRRNRSWNEEWPERNCTIGTGFVVTRENYREVVDCARTVKALGVDNLRISAVFQPDNAAYFADFYDEAAALCKEAEAESCADGDGSGSFQVFNNFGERLDDLTLGNPDYEFCGYQHFNTYIGADLNVYRCCVYAYNERGKIGSIQNQRFADLWASEAKKKDFAEFDARGCERCQFNGKNKTILYALDGSPPHVNFV